MDIPFNELEILVTIGTGTFGRVKLVQHKATGTVAALKAMSKVQIVQSHQEKNIMNEKVGALIGWSRFILFAPTPLLTSPCSSLPSPLSRAPT